MKAVARENAADRGQSARRRSPAGVMIAVHLTARERARLTATRRVARCSSRTGGIAADVRAGEAKVVAQQVGQQRAVLDLERMGFAVYRQADPGHWVVFTKVRRCADRAPSATTPHPAASLRRGAPDSRPAHACRHSGRATSTRAADAVGIEVARERRLCFLPAEHPGAAPVTATRTAAPKSATNTPASA